MRFYALFAAVLLLHLPCAAQRRVSIHGRDLPIDIIVNVIESQSGDSVKVYGKIFDDWPGVTLDLENVPVDVALDSCFSGLNFRYQIVGRKIYVYREPFYNSPLYLPVRGRAVSEGGEPLPLAKIAVRDHRDPLLSDDGAFGIPMNGFFITVTVSCPGYVTQQLELTNKVALNTVVLQKEATSLNEVVVEGYKNSAKRAVIGTPITLKAGDILIQHASNPLDLLQAQVPGLSIVRPNGFSNGEYSVLLRGRRSIGAGNDPLYVVDGLPFPSSSGTGIIGPGSPVGGSNPLNSISPEDIAEITVLVGPASTAIYGSRAANGVVLITRKKGLSGPLRLNADVSYELSRAMMGSRLLNTREFLALRDEAAKNDGYGSTAVPEYAWDTSRSSDFRKAIIGNPARGFNGHIDLTGGTSGCYFLLSGNASTQSTILGRDTRDSRGSIYGYLHLQSPNSRIKLAVSLSYSAQGERLPQEDLTRYMFLAPNAPLYTGVGADRRLNWGADSLAFSNFIGLENNSYELRVHHLLGNAQAVWQIKDDLYIETSLGFYRRASDERGTTAISGQDPSLVPAPTGQLSLGSAVCKNGIGELLARYRHEWDWGLLETLAGGTLQTERTDSSSTTVAGLTNDVLLATGNGGTAVYSANRVNYVYAAVFGQATYTLKKKYVFSATGRRDGSSRWSHGHQYGTFGSFGASWVFGEESFFHFPRWVSLGKLRASYGTVGNDQIQDYQYALSYSTVSAGGARQGFLPTTLYNPSLHFETYKNQEAGLDLGFLENRIGLSVVAYRSWSTSQLLVQKLAIQSGAPGVMSNLPIRVQNDGLDVVLRASVGKKGGLQWASSLNLTIPDNKLVSYPGLAVSSNATTYVTGKSLSVSQALHFVGVDPGSGLYQFADRNKDDTLNYKDFVPTKSRDPRCYGSWSNSISYKGVRLDIVLAFCWQNGWDPLAVLDQINYTGAGSQVVGQLSNGPVEWLDRWQKPGDRSGRQRLTVLQPGMPGAGAADALLLRSSSDVSVRDASYARLKNLCLSWQIPESWLKPWRLKGLQVYFRAHDLLTLTRYPVTDPEIQNPTVFPLTRSWKFGFSLTL